LILGIYASPRLLQVGPSRGMVRAGLHSHSPATATAAPCPRRHASGSSSGNSSHAHTPAHLPAEPAVKRGRGVLQAAQSTIPPLVRVEAGLEPLVNPIPASAVWPRSSSVPRKCPRCQNYLTPFEGETTYHCAVCSVWFMARDDQAIDGEAGADASPTMHYKKVRR